jgi:hypothetical protein
MPEIQFHSRLEAPFQRDFVDRDGALATIHGGSVVVRRVQVGAVMGDELDRFNGPGFSVGRVVLAEPRKHAQQLGKQDLVVAISDSGR